MEATPKTRGPYKKHKDGFKVTVKHYVNEKVRIELPYNQIHSPLYVQVIAKQKHISFKSRIDVHAMPVESLSEWIKSPYGLSVLNTERDNIEQVTKTMLDNTSQEFRVSLIPESYKNLHNLEECVKIALTEKICAAYDEHYNLSPSDSSLSQYRGIHPFVLYRQWRDVPTVSAFVGQLEVEVWNFDFFYFKFRNIPSSKYVYSSLEPTKLDFDNGKFERELKDFYHNDLARMESLFKDLKSVLA